jgi:hypothetical protein
MHVVAVAGDEDPAHLGGGHAVHQAGGEERAAADADVTVHAGQIDAIEGIVQRAQRAEFVHGADRAAAGDGEADAGGRRDGCLGGLAFALAGFGLHRTPCGVE